MFGIKKAKDRKKAKTKKPSGSAGKTTTGTQRATTRIASPKTSKTRSATTRKTTKKATTRKAATKKKAAPKKEAAPKKKTAAKKAATTKKATTRKTAPKKKAGPKKMPKKKTAAKKTPKKSTTTRTATRATTRRAEPKKTAAKKATSKKKATTRKAAPKKTAKTVSGKSTIAAKARSKIAPPVKPPFESYKGSKPYIFTSYAHKNMGDVFGIIRELNKSRYRIWYDEGIEPGNEWPEIVGKAVLGCSQFLVFMSSTAAKSRNVRNEINLAFSEDKDILVIFLEKANLTEGMKLQIGTVQFINRYEMKESEFLEKLKKVLNSDLRG